ncbi:MAG: GMC family oxidoreductase [Gemmatimonadetes bacterium]|nr:GMC family oxidoreductase [Gemmatimonadota bacterium]
MSAFGRRRVEDADVVIVGAGITAAMTAWKLSETTDRSILVVEAGDRPVPLSERMERRQRYLDYGENPWTADHLDDMTAPGIMSRSMGVGGLAMHWGGAVPRFTPEDFRVRSLYGVGDDWPIGYDDLEPYYQEAEEKLGVAGERGPPELDRRARPYPLPRVPFSESLERLKAWAERSGTPFWANPVARVIEPYAAADGARGVCRRCDTCNICPTGAKYTPDITFDWLESTGRIRLLPRRLVRRLEVAPGSDRIEAAVAAGQDRPDEPVRITGRTFVLAGGYTWAPWLLLVSAGGRFPDGLANSSGLVGRYMNGHRNVQAYVEVDFPLFPGEFGNHSLLSQRFQSHSAGDGRYVRHDFRVWDSTSGREPRLADDGGRLLLGDALLEDWRARAATGAVRLRSYYDVLPHRESRIEIDPGLRNRWGDPLPRLRFRDDDASAALRGHTEDLVRARFDDLVRAGGGRIMRTFVDETQDHPGGGARMGDDPATSVVDSRGRAWDHENLFVVGAPTMVTGGCANGTLTFCALTLRQAEEVARS